MIDLFSVKLNNTYDEIGAIPTIENGTFLCDTTSENYTRGYSYQITNGNAVRIEAAQDYKIKNAIYPTIQSVCEWLNNWFTNTRKCKCIGCMWTSDDLQTGDLVRVEVKNQYPFASYVTITDDGIIYDNTAYNITGQPRVKIMAIPQDFELAISQMIFYDVFTRGTVDGLKSESVGNYSYTKDDITVGTLAYPKALISGLDANYRKLRFVQ